MRDVQMIPTKGHLRVKRHSDSDFPNEKTFRRLGNKNQLAAKIISYCQKRDGYDDIIGICAPHAEQKQVRIKPLGSNGVDGFVYLMKSGRYYKIGKTNAAGRREYELAIQLPEKPNTVHVIKTDDPTGIEAYWHKRVDAKRKGGELFDLNADDIRAFKRRKFM